MNPDGGWLDLVAAAAAGLVIAAVVFATAFVIVLMVQLLARASGTGVALAGVFLFVWIVATIKLAGSIP